MAEQLEEMKREFKTITDVANQKVNVAVSFNRKLEEWPGHRNHTLNQIAARAKELKAQGPAGIRQDAEIKHLEAELHVMDKDIEAIEVFVQAWGKPTQQRVSALETRLNREITTRSKELTTKMGVGNKSLPEMRALLVEVQRFKQSNQYKAITGVKDQNYHSWQTQLVFAVNHEIELAGRGRS